MWQSFALLSPVQPNFKLTTSTPHSLHDVYYLLGPQPSTGVTGLLRPMRRARALARARLVL